VTWQDPYWLWALLALPVLVVGLVAWERGRRGAASAYADPAVLPVGARPRRRRLRVIAAILALLAVACGPVALAKPSIDRTAQEKRGAVVIAIDESRSMLKTDLQPDRLKAAIAAAKRFLEVVPKRTAVGLVFFSKNARIVVAPSTDREAVSEALDRPRVGVGTAIGNAVVAGLASLRAAGVLNELPPTPAQSAGRILLLTDGANSAGLDPEVGGERAKAARVPVFTFLLGNDPGRPDQPSPAETLSSLATQTGGSYFQTVTTNDLRTVFQDLGERLAPVRRLDQLTVYVALAALVLLAAAAGVMLLADGRRPRARGSAAAWPG
jgi:Ca-activated chloride channel homolog